LVIEKHIESEKKA